MSNSWENLQPAPIEYFHGRLMDLFHEFRLTKGTDINVQINGIEFGDIVAKAKRDTYRKYNRNLPFGQPVEITPKNNDTNDRT